MRLNFKKISALATSALMVGMTAGVAAAANYPAPFVVGGSADVAIVYGTGTGVSIFDSIEAGNIQTNLQSQMGTTSGGTTGSVTGEAYALWTSSRKIYMNDSINIVKSSLTDSQLPTVLADADFEGNVNADVTLSIKIGPTPRITFDNHLTSDDDPKYAMLLGTGSSTYTYNSTITFDKAVNLTHSDSIGESIVLFGQKFTVGAGSTKTNLYLYKSSETIDLSVGGSDPTSQTVTVDGNTYTVELTGASDASATIKVTDSSGNSDSKEITEDNSKKISGLDVAVNLADEDTATNRLTAQITVGADKLKFVDGSTVKVGSDEDTIEGTQISQGSGTDWGNITTFTVQVFSKDDEVDGLLPGQELVDPVFGSFKIDFAGLNIDTDSTSRETFEIGTSSNDKATLKMTTHTGANKDGGTFTWYYNSTGAGTASQEYLQDSSGNMINILEMAQVNKSEYVVVGNEENGYLLKLTTVNNDTQTSADDYFELQDVFDSTKTYKSQTPSAEGTAIISIEGEDYTGTYVGSDTTANRYVRLNYPDSTTVASHAVIYPTIQTSKGAKMFFYAPQNITLTAWDGTNPITKLRFPDGDGYTDVDLVYTDNESGDQQGAVNVFHPWNVTVGTTTTELNTSAGSGNLTTLTIGELTYEIRGDTHNKSQIRLRDVGGTAITGPAIVFFEEQDDSTNKAYNAIIVKMEGLATSTDGVGVDDVEFTWGSDAWADNKQLQATDNDKYSDADYYGVIVTRDDSDSDQSTAIISYPDDQLYAQVYVGEVDAAITAGTSGSSTSTPLGEVLVKDSEVSSVSSKNLIVIGGSCINSAAAKLVDGSYCGAAWTDATGVGTGKFLIKGYATSNITSKLALLVAGYEYPDTINAAKYLRTKAVDTSQFYIGSSATSAELQVTTA
ncbi:MAG: hypothetical protein ABIH59_01255 [archaeon]